eukprot:7706661-Alexandrium_andersonii.AAC.1
MLDDRDVAEEGSDHVLLRRLLRRPVPGCKRGLSAVRPHGFGQGATNKTVPPCLQPTTFMPAATVMTLASDTIHWSTFGDVGSEKRAIGLVDPAGRKNNGS